MNQTTYAILYDLLGRWLADPERDLESAVMWCERYLHDLPYSLIDNTPQQIAYQVGGAYRRAHPHRLERWTRALGGH